MDAVIVAGGRGARMGGVAKALIEIDGRAILDHQISMLAPWVDRLFVSVQREGQLAQRQGTEQIVDKIADAGPLAGIHAALAASDAAQLLILGCDYPFVSDALVHALRTSAPEAAALVPRIGDRLQPLCARVSRASLASLGEFLARGERRASQWFASIETQELREENIRSFDPQLRCMINLNTPRDVDRARQIWLTSFAPRSY